MIKLLSPANGAEVSVTTSAQRDFIRRFRAGSLNGKDFPPDGIGAYDYLPPKKKAGRDLATPAFTVFRWSGDGPAAASFFGISEDASFSAPAPVSVGTVRESGERDGEFFVTVTNLAMGKTYFWRAGDGAKWCEPFSFTTPEDGVRFLWVEGLSNVRDLGGRRNAAGRRMKQGMLYRGPAIEAIIDPPYEITKRGKKTFAHDLGIRTEIDIREEAYQIIRSCPVSDDITYCQIPFESYKSSLEKESGDGLRKIFRILSDPASYPVYFHCQIGSDRTGTLAMYVYSALGFSTDEIDFDYSVNSLTLTEKRSFTGSREVTEFLGLLAERYPGADVPEMMRARIRAAGVTDETVAALRGLLMEDGV